MLDFYVKTRIRFSLRDKRLYEITEVEITRVNCVIIVYIGPAVVLFHKLLSQYQFKFRKHDMIVKVSILFQKKNTNVC